MSGGWAMEKDPVRVCFVALKFHPVVGGTEVQAEKQARHLLAWGHQVFVLTLRLERTWPRTEVLAGLRVVRVGGVYRRNGHLRIGRLGIWAAMVGVSLQVWRRRAEFDVIHVFQLSPVAAAAVLMGKVLRKPVIVMIQSAGPSQRQLQRLERGATLMPDLLANTSFLRVDREDWATSGDLNHLPHAAIGGPALLHYLRRSDAYFQVLSMRCASALVSQCFRGDRVVHIPGSVNTDLFRPAQESRPSFDRPERDIVCIARLSFAKGVDVLLHAWSRMMHAPGVWRAELRPRLFLVGDGPNRSQLERIAKELGIQDSISFLGLRRDTVDLLQRAWGFVLPSRWEGMPNALLEAMACALPCVATRVSGSEDIITEGVNGLLVEPEDPVALAEALRRLIADADLAQRMAVQARHKVVQTYQLGEVVQRCVALYRQVCATAHRSMNPSPRP